MSNIKINEYLEVVILPLNDDSKHQMVSMMIPAVGRDTYLQSYIPVAVMYSNDVYRRYVENDRDVATKLQDKIIDVVMRALSTDTHTYVTDIGFTADVWELESLDGVVLSNRPEFHALASRYLYLI
jgi:hypothetical protein